MPCSAPRRFGFGCTLRMFTFCDVDVEELLDGLAHLRLVRVRVHLERVLPVARSGCSSSRRRPARAASRSGGGSLAGPPWTSGSAASLISSARAQTTVATSSSDGTVTSARGRLRNDLISVSSSSVATTHERRVLAPRLDGELLACFVDGAPRSAEPSSTSRACRSRRGCESAPRSAAAARLAVHLHVEAAHRRGERRRRRP